MLGFRDDPALKQSGLKQMRPWLMKPQLRMMCIVYGSVHSYNNFQQWNPPILNRIQKQSIVFIIFIPSAFKYQ
jgi:hypothetical protein